MRYGSVIGLRAEKLDEYKKLHAAVWPEVVEAMHDANIRNYSIYLRKCPTASTTCSATSSTWAGLRRRT